MIYLIDLNELFSYMLMTLPSFIETERLKSSKNNQKSILKIFWFVFFDDRLTIHLSEDKTMSIVYMAKKNVYKIEQHWNHTLDESEQMALRAVVKLTHNSNLFIGKVALYLFFFESYSLKHSHLIHSRTIIQSHFWIFPNPNLWFKTCLSLSTGGVL